MTNSQKLAIKEKVLLYTEKFTNAELSRKSGVGEANISVIRSWAEGNKYPADAQWRKLETFFSEAIHMDSPNYLSIIAATTMACETASRVAIDGYTGAGKTYALRAYERENPETSFLITGRRSMGHRALLWELAKRVGVDKFQKMSLYDLEVAIKNKIESSQKRIVLMFDELEYVKPACLDCIKTLCDLLENKCGIVVCGIIKEVLGKNAEKGKGCYPQFFRRFAHRWEAMQPISKQEIKYVCANHGIVNPDVVAFFSRTVKEYDTFQTLLLECQKVGADITVEYLLDILKGGLEGVDSTPSPKKGKKGGTYGLRD